ncbi:uncharacterized protein JN550_008898 [Neoarthrinium moseri]|uniref:uncharacterized protein n=1 Tax=Neoarthrinium moseri TaxID=1658444 RepID=UPI001FDE03E4|nr:uncharacterized protein JN550_008898 [Neoarthrinium moseri]KAI1864341.1 hypothetical protein JN550_008898 [Neoarthrinium moseri]
MKFLCLHGAFGSAAGFKVQLRPFVDEVARANSSSFVWVDGLHPSEAPVGYTEFFGGPPYYRHMQYEGTEGLDQLMSRVREFPEGLGAEDTLRFLIRGFDELPSKALEESLGRLFDIIDKDPEIDGILGYSEGAILASTLILEEQRRLEEEGIPRRIKVGYAACNCEVNLMRFQGAIFFSGWPPVRYRDGKMQHLLADECDSIVDVPTCHIVGCNDPYIHGAIALYNMCDEDTVVLFDHGKGHTVPRDKKTIKELAETITMTIHKATCLLG